MAEVSESDIRSLAPDQLTFVGSEEKWLREARPAQILPLTGWSLAVARPGRGWGKTRTGSEWVRRESGLYPGIITHIVAPSHADLCGTMMGGVSGIIAATPPELIESTNFSAAIPTIKFKNGSLVRGFSAQSPDRLRGPQGHRVWADEAAAWGAGAELTMDNIAFSTRLAYKMTDGRLIQPQRFFTTTPRPLRWLEDLINRADIAIEGSSHENKANLAEEFIRDLEIYKGTKIYEQEVLGKLLSIGEAAIIKQSWLRIWENKRPLPWFDFVIVVMDTALTERTYDKKTFEADPTCCQVWGVFAHERRWNLLLLERWSEHVGFPELVRRAKKELKAEYGRRSEILFKPLVGQQLHAEQVKRPDLLMIEDKGSGISLRQMLSSEGIDSYPYNPGKADKLARLHAVSHVAANGRIWLPESTKVPGTARNWILPMIDEVCSYSGPGTTKHDDDVDTFAMASRYFADRWLTAGIEGVIKPGTSTVNVPTSLAGEEWIEGEDRLPGHEDDQLDSPYG